MNKEAITQIQSGIQIIDKAMRELALIKKELMSSLPETSPRKQMHLKNPITGKVTWFDSKGKPIKDPSTKPKTSTRQSKSARLQP